VGSFSEAMLATDPSIEADLKSALRKQGIERTTALNTLREKLVKASHRKQLLGDLMLLHLLTRKDAGATTKDCAVAACRDFITTGHSELMAFIERCRQGQATLPNDVTGDASCGLQAVREPDYAAVLIMGIILKLGHSNKPAGDVATLLNTFHKLKQRNGESAYDYLNRFSNHITTMQSYVGLVQQEDHMPPKGEWTTPKGEWTSQRKKGSKPNIRKRAAELLQADRIPLQKVSFTQVSSALLRAEPKITEAE